jgi:heparan-alpha-glucosaminide N-acetyltransferase
VCNHKLRCLIEHSFVQNCEKVYHRSLKARLQRLVLHGAICLLLGATLCGFKQHGGFIPVNKNLWSTSFVLVTAGGGCWVLAGLYLIVDEYKLWDGAPFRYTGMNSIVVYAGSEVFEPYFPFSFATTANSHWGHLATNVIGASCWNAIATYMYNNRIFVKV